MTGKLRVESQAITDVGHIREHNEDFFGIFPEEGLFLVADGMGGHSSGDRASKLAVEMMREFFQATRRDPNRAWPFKMDRAKSYEENRLVTGVRIGNRRIWDDSEKNRSYAGMGTTVVALSVTDDAAQIAHVGDSRAYRLRDGAIELLTEDHSLLNDYRRYKSDLSPEDLAEIPRNVITRALGMRDDLEVEIRTEKLLPGDIYLLCSDGLHGMIEDKEIESILKDTSDLAASARSLLDAALKGGGTDNITLILVRISASEAAGSAA